MPLSSIANINVAANQANKQNSEPAAEQLEKSRVGLFSENKNTTFSDNVTLTKAVSSSTSEKTAGPDTLDPHSADTLLKQTMEAIMKNSKTAVSAQANLTPRIAQTLLADK